MPQSLPCVRETVSAVVGGIHSVIAVSVLML
ncbi:MAG: hypothetical protein RIS70_2895, partial [Planctomycetota bacterium]